MTLETFITMVVVPVQIVLDILVTTIDDVVTLETVSAGAIFPREGEMSIRSKLSARTSDHSRGCFLLEHR